MITFVERGLFIF